MEFLQGGDDALGPREAQREVFQVQGCPEHHRERLAVVDQRDGCFLGNMVLCGLDRFGLHPPDVHRDAGGPGAGEIVDVHDAAASCIAQPCASSDNCSSLNWRKRFCHSDGWVTGSTWTAVTLNSGQFVAQSELSVVITLAPDSGKWKVV